MKIRELIALLERHDPNLTVNVFSSDGDYDKPQVSLVSKNGKITRVTITATKDE